MLDKSVPYAGVYMCRSADTPLIKHPLPEGYTFSLYRDGDELYWARIETSVLEFESEFAALLYFKEKYLPFREELHNRCIFVETENGEKAATATAWYEIKNGTRQPWLHWVAVTPEYQGKGLGRAVISHAVGLLLNDGGDIYLRTQTWSHKAVGIYKSFGFEVSRDKALYKSTGDKRKKAEHILKRLEKNYSRQDY